MLHFLQGIIVLINWGYRELTCSSSAPTSHLSLNTSLLLRLFLLPGIFPGDVGLLGEARGELFHESPERGEEAKFLCSRSRAACRKWSKETGVSGLHRESILIAGT
jgi:hypothetical protein